MAVPGPDADWIGFRSRMLAARGVRRSGPARNWLRHLHRRIRDPTHVVFPSLGPPGRPGWAGRCQLDFSVPVPLTPSMSVPKRRGIGIEEVSGVERRGVRPGSVLAGGLRVRAPSSGSQLRRRQAAPRGHVDVTTVTFRWESGTRGGGGGSARGAEAVGCVSSGEGVLFMPKRGWGLGVVFVLWTCAQIGVA